ncbi:MAG: CBS domain-containing protein [Ruminococcus sp.]|jgi:CBS domain-containing protein|nr:CBS domain-containing protein [Ruminococcus sp.]
MNILFLLQPKSEVALLSDTSSVGDAIKAFAEFRFSAIPVTNADGEYFGTVTATDFLSFVLSGDSFDDKKVGEILDRSKNPPVRITAKLDDLLELVMDQNFVPVVDDRNCFMGIVTRKRIMRYYYYDRLKAHE